MMLTQQCHPQHHSDLVTWIGTPATKLRGSEFLSKSTASEQEPYKRNPVMYIHMHVFTHMHMYMCVWICNSVGDAVWDAVPLAGSWQAVAVRAWFPLPGVRKLPASSAGLTFTEGCP